MSSIPRGMALMLRVKPELADGERFGWDVGLREGQYVFHLLRMSVKPYSLSSSYLLVTLPYWFLFSN